MSWWTCLGHYRRLRRRGVGRLEAWRVAWDLMTASVPDVLP